MRRFSAIRAPKKSRATGRTSELNCRLSTAHQRAREKFESDKGKTDQEPSSRFDELLCGLADEHARSLQIQRATYEEQLRRLQPIEDRKCTVKASAGGCLSRPSDAILMGGGVPGSLHECSVLYEHAEGDYGKSLSDCDLPPAPILACKQAASMPLPPGEDPPALPTAGGDDESVSVPANWLRKHCPETNGGRDMDSILPSIIQHATTETVHSHVQQSTAGKQDFALPVGKDDHLVPVQGGEPNGFVASENGSACLHACNKPQNGSLAEPSSDPRKSEIMKQASRITVVNSNYMRAGTSDSIPGESHNARQALMLQGVPAKWAHLVQRAFSVAAVGMYIPRQVWKEGLKKHAAKENYGSVAQTHLKTMMSAMSMHENKTMMSRGKVMMNLGNLVATVNEKARFEALDPHSGRRLAWTFTAMVFMFYDLVMLPLQAFKPPYGLVFHAIDIIAQVYWTLDIVCCFITAVYVNSMIEKRFLQIARIYARSWLAFDLLVTLPQWYTMLLGQASPGISNMKGIRFVRMLRFVRLARLAKFDHVLAELLEVVNSPYIILVIGVVKLMVGLCMFNHVICCIWFGIGSSTGGWVDKWDVTHETIWYQYLTSMHWALTQFQGTSEVVPGTTSERAYAVAFLLSALIIMACFVSCLTTNMGQLKDMHNEKYSQQRAVRNYLAENRISTQLCVQINRYIEWNRRQKHRNQQDAEVLLVLPTKLLMDLYDEVRNPVLAVHPFFYIFRQSFSRVLRRICFESLEQKSPCPSDLVYAEGDECFHMYFIMSGQLRYQPHPTSIGRVNKAEANWQEEMDVEDDDVFTQVLDSPVYRPIRVREFEWLSEAVLWTPWEHCGDLIGLEECSLLLLDASRFASIVETFAAARSVAALYARYFVGCLNRFGHVFTDVIKHSELFDDEDLDIEDDTMKNTSAVIGNLQIIPN